MLELTTSVCPGCGEPTDNINVFNGTVRSGNEYTEEVGTIELFVIDLYRGFDDGWPPWQVLDSYDQGLAAFCALFDRKEPAFHPKVLRLTKIEFSGLLVLNRLEIKESYRGKKLGLKAVLLACDQFKSGCQVAALKAFPLQWEGNARKENSAQLKLDQAKLVRYYRRAGFKSFNRDGIMVRAL